VRLRIDQSCGVGRRRLSWPTAKLSSQMSEATSVRVQVLKRVVRGCPLAIIPQARRLACGLGRDAASPRVGRVCEAHQLAPPARGATKKADLRGYHAIPAFLCSSLARSNRLPM